VRCDLHPRWSPDGRWLSVDSAHTGVRRSYLVDVAALLAS
jgi:Tol biopolymer transport system component